MTIVQRLTGTPDRMALLTGILEGVSDLVYSQPVTTGTVGSRRQRGGGVAGGAPLRRGLVDHPDVALMTTGAQAATGAGLVGGGFCQMTGGSHSAGPMTIGTQPGPVE